MTGLISTDRQHSPQPHETCGACIAAGLQRAGQEDEALEFLSSNPLSESLVVSSLGQIGCSAHLSSVSHHGENQPIALYASRNTRLGPRRGITPKNR